jgi:hypothetical protein
MANVGQDIYNAIKATNTKLASEAKKEHPSYAPYSDGDNYFSGKTAEAIQAAFDTYCGDEGNALLGLKAATSTLLSVMAGMSATPFAPLAVALTAWFTVFQSYLGQMDVTDAKGIPVIPD